MYGEQRAEQRAERREQRAASEQNRFAKHHEIYFFLVLAQNSALSSGMPPVHSLHRDISHALHRDISHALQQDKRAKKESLAAERQHALLVAQENKCRLTVDHKAEYVARHTRKQRDFSHLQQWIYDCLKGHSDCFKPCRTASLPTRLIDVGSGDVSPTLRLILSQAGNLRHPPHYIALSHCWGKPDAKTREAMTTTTASLQSRLEDIDLESLPRTFRDAVAVTRGLGIPYLWIDSLCILQDCIEDWNAEFARMGSVYRNSICCLSAAAASDPDDGCFVDKIELPPRLPERAWDSGLKAGTLDFVVTCNKIIAAGAVSRRAWCLQERFLSPRIIHYTRHGVIWDCQEDLKLGNRLQAGPGRYVVKSLVKPSTAALVHDGGSKGEDFFENIYRHWFEIVRDYSARSLTVESDRLPALSGLASEVEKATGYHYFVGIWKESFLEGLIWRCTEEDIIQGRSRRSLEHRAPSWSWGAIDGQVEFDPSGMAPKCFVVSVDCIEDDKTTMVACLHTIEVKKVRWKQGIIYHCKGGSYKLYPDDHLDFPSDFTLFWCIVLWTTVSGTSGGLILRPEAGKCLYSRLGYFESTKEHDCKSHRKRMVIIR